MVKQPIPNLLLQTADLELQPNLESGTNKLNIYHFGWRPNCNVTDTGQNGGTLGLSVECLFLPVPLQ